MIRLASRHAGLVTPTREGTLQLINRWVSTGFDYYFDEDHNATAVQRMTRITSYAVGPFVKG